MATPFTSTLGTSTSGSVTSRVMAQSGTVTQTAITAAGTGDVNTAKAALEKVRKIFSDGVALVNQKALGYSLSRATSQPSTTPTITSSLQNGMVNTDTDSYRSGGFSDTGSTTEDNLLNPRMVGEDEDNIASISISTSTDQSLQTTADASATEIVYGDIVNAYSRFFLQGVSEAQTEKYQIVETFTDFYTFFYGKRPSTYNFRGMLMNDPNNKWTNDLMFFYENFFRGTKAVEIGAQAVINYDGRVVSGFILDLNVQQSAELDKGAMFSLNMLVVEHVPVNFSADMDSVISDARKSLKAAADAILQQISVINRSIPTAERLQVASATNGAIPMASVDMKGSKPIKQGKKK